MVKKKFYNPVRGLLRAGGPRDGVFPSSRRWLSYAISVLLTAQPVLPAYAAGIDVATGNTRVDQAGNGVAIVDIATPNEAGISHNKYNDFNVGKDGLILNNSTDRLTQTQLGGLIQNNTNLQAGKEARGIINEVVGTNRTELQGYMEVGGKSASVMVANPYGITCDGCGFINTPNVTLTTGKPVMGADGNVEALEVSRGTITIQGKGLDAGNSDGFNLISRATEINAGIHAKDLTVITGTNRVNKDGTITSIAAASDEEKPKIAIDTGALGGMYANRIRLVSSEKGVGVNIGNLNARQGDIQIDASGKLKLNNTLTAGALKAQAESIELTGAHRAEQDVSLASQGDMALNGAVLSAGKDVSLNSGGKLSISQSRVQAGVDAKGNLNPGNQLNVSAADLNMIGSRLEAGSVKVSASKSLTQDRSSRLSALNDLELEGGELELNGQNEAGRDVSLKASRLKTGAGSKITAQRDVRAEVSADANMRGKVSASRDLTLTAAKASNRGELRAGRNSSLQAGSLENQGVIQAQGSQTISAGDVVNSGTVTADGALYINAAGLSNDGRIGARQAVSLNVTGLLNVGAEGMLYSDGALDIFAGRFLLAGLTQGQGNVTLTAGDITTVVGSRLLSGADMTLTADSLSLAGLVSADGRLTVNGGTLFTDSTSRIQAQNGISVTATQSGELNGVFYTLGDLYFSGGDLLHLAQSNAGRISINADSLTNGGLLQSAGELDVEAQTVVQQGIILAQGAAVFAVRSMNNAGSISAGELQIAASDDFTNDASGSLSTSGRLSLSTWRAENYGRINGGGIWLQAESVSNQGQIQATGNLDIRANQRLDNGVGAFLVAGENLTLQSDYVYNAGIVQARSIQLSAGSLDNDDAIRALEKLFVQVDGVLANRGSLLSGGEISVTAGTLDDTGTIEGNASVGEYASIMPYRNVRMMSNSLLLSSASMGWESSLENVSSSGGGQLVSAGGADAEIAGRTPFDGLYEMVNEKPPEAPRETAKAYTDHDTFIATDYFLDRIDLHPDYDYRFSADSVNDDRYADNAALKTAGRYMNGAGAEMAQLQALIESAAGQGSGVRLATGILLTADLVTSLTHSIIGETDKGGGGKPALYLSPHDIQLLDGNIIGSGKMKLHDATNKQASL